MRGLRFAVLLQLFQLKHFKIHGDPWKSFLCSTFRLHGQRRPLFALRRWMGQTRRPSSVSRSAGTWQIRWHVDLRPWLVGAQGPGHMRNSQRLRRYVVCWVTFWMYGPICFMSLHDSLQRIACHFGESRVLNWDVHAGLGWHHLGDDWFHAQGGWLVGDDLKLDQAERFGQFWTYLDEWIWILHVQLVIFLQFLSHASLIYGAPAAKGVAGSWKKLNWAKLS